MAAAPAPAAAAATAGGPPLHVNVAHVGALIGTWKGTGRGFYPTIASFEYKEEVTFAHAGKPWLSYSQRTWRVTDGAPLHAETGYWRFPGDNKVEMLITQPSGVSEVSEGSWSAQSSGAGEAKAAGDSPVVISTKTDNFTRTATARPPHVTSATRVFTLHPAAAAIGSGNSSSSSSSIVYASCMYQHEGNKKPEYLTLVLGWVADSLFWGLRACVYCYLLCTKQTR